GAREISCEATILVNGLFDVVGAGVGTAECGLLLGPTIVAEQRYPNVQCRLIDVRLPRAPKEAGQVVSQICTELMHQHEHHDNRVALRGLHRWVLGYESLPLAKPESAVSGGLRNQGVYLITGAFGRLGRVLARALAQAVSARLVLVGRRLDREKEQTYFDELSLSGAQVLALDA